VGRVSEFRSCGCDWDPEFHRDLNKRRGKADQGERCTNPVYAAEYMQQGGICLACIHGCAE
jgi:hypothetical protein